jgi:hypothetical protein
VSHGGLDSLQHQIAHSKAQMGKLKQLLREHSSLFQDKVLLDDE